MEVTNQTLANGQKLIIKTKIPIMGISLLKNYVDETLGEMGQSKYLKKFRYSKDGGTTFSEWYELTDSNISKVNLASSDWYIFEYEYTHQGVRNPMYFSSSVLSAKVRTSQNTDIYDKTDFSEYFDVNDTEVIGWAYNVLEKLYEQGILPKYFSRNNVKDFQDYWLTVTHFFALIVKMGRLLEDIPNNKILFERFLDGRGLFLSGEETQTQREYLFNNYIGEYAKRGTFEVFLRNGENLGEFLRLINNKQKDELLYSALFNDEIGWCLGSSSPTWEQTQLTHSVVKGYEYGENVDNINRYPVRQGTQVVQLNGYKYLQLSANNFLGNYLSNFTNSNVIEYGDGSLKGIDGNVTTLFKVVPTMDYEISFRLARQSSSNIEFSLFTLGENFTVTNLINGKDGTNSNVFGNFTVKVEQGKEGLYRACLLQKGTTYNKKLSVNVPNGNNLINKGDTIYIVPQIKILGDSEALVRDIKIKPLYLPCSQGQLGEKELFLSYMKNNSLKSNLEVNRLVERYLLPYKLKIWSHFINT